MIVKMIRYDFLVYHRDLTDFLERLRGVGVVDITLTNFAPTPEQAADIALAKHLMAIYKALRSIKPAGTPYNDCADAIDAYDKATADYQTAKNAIVHAQAEIEQVQAWGEFDPKSIDNLREKGIALRFFETTPKAYKSEWEQDLAIEVVRRTDSKIHFVVAQNVDDAQQKLNISAIELKAPASSVSQKQAEIERLLAQQVEAQNVIAAVANSMDEIKEQSLLLTEKIDFQKVEGSGDDVAEGTIKILEGWSAEADRAKIEAFAQNEEVIFTSEDAKAAQNPPIKLKNSFFARLYEPIGALYVLPRYNELDMTPFFAPFFMLFFGMCFGDAGYGLLLIAAILVMWRKIPKKFKDLAWLGIFLNLGAVIFGTLTGNVFGIELVKIAALEPYKEYFLNSDTVFVLAVIIGAVQVLFGQILRIFNRIKRGGSFMYGLSSIGWVVLFISSIVAFTDVAGEVFSSSSVAYYATLSVAGVLILFFNNPKKNLFVNFGGGLYNVYEMATGVAGDLISYVRLFAIGVAGTVIAQVFNELAMGMSGDIPVVSVIIMLIILLIGHGLNIFISALGAFVHPVRLTFVEFYKNAEFEGGGRKFTPFARKINNNK